MSLIASIDQGTSSSRFLIFDPENGELVDSHQIEVKQIFPKPGWVEMDPKEIIATVLTCIEKVIGNCNNNFTQNKTIEAVGITNQRETVVAWDKNTGEPLYNAIVWLDDRTSSLAEDFIKKTPNQSKDYFRPISGLPIHPYFSALKIVWLFQNVPRVQTALKNQSLMIGTIDAWLFWKLCGVYVTDVTNASRTNLMDLDKLAWSQELCDFYGIPIEILPEIKSSSEIYGSFLSGPLKGIRIAGCLGDQQAALVGHNCLQSGDTKSTYGTGTFMLCNTGKKRINSINGLLTTIAFQFGSNGSVSYALEGSGSIGGNCVKFLRDNLQFIKEASEVEELASSVSSTEDVYFVPCFTGLFTPHWDANARGTIIGITQRTTPAHISLAALKSVAFQTADIIGAIEKDLKMPIGNLKVDGGMTANKLFNQLLSDHLGRAIYCSNFTEVTGLGAAISAGLCIGLLTVESLSKYSSNTAPYEPKIGANAREVELTRWEEAVKRSLSWVK